MRNLLHRSLMSKISKEYFTIEALEGGLTVKLSNNASSYRIDDGSWTNLSAGTATPSINAGQKMQFRITNPTINSSTGIGTFTVNKKFNVEGNIMSLLYGDNFANQQSLTAGSKFSYLFQNCTTLINAKDLILPATTLVIGCYEDMFSGCKSLTTAPALPATTLATSCYTHMFYDCTSLTTAPALPATTLAGFCYNSMFAFCSSLTTAPEILPATTLTNYCYDNMFQGCTGLKTAPALPATTLADFCYYGMFSLCSSLTTAPEILPATTLAIGCYEDMFQGCTSLTTAPALPATTLADSCYSYMFALCSSLTTAPALPATTLADSCYSYMFVFCYNLNYIKMLATNISASGCLTDWVSNVATTGTFVKHIDMNSLPTGENGIPTGWRVFNQEHYSYFTIEALENGLRVSLSQTASQYRIGSGGWTNLSAGSTTSLVNAGQKIQFRISNPTINSSNGIGTFTVNKKFNVEGNIMSLLYGDNFATQQSLTGKDYVFEKLFYDCVTLQSAKKLILPATTLATSCYDDMFQGCTSLTTAPALPATTLADSCYEDMFYDCTSLTTAPALPATTLADSCYRYMFDGCTSLTTAPEILPATTLALDCYVGMFYGCTSLTTAPALPATTLTNYCYDNMFQGCTSLTTAPALPATTLADSCYSYMFSGCTSLTTAPEILPATTLADSCYDDMFYGCTSLTTAPALPATTLADYCYTSMFSGCTKLNYIKMLAKNISASGCLTDWVNNVATTGTFVKNICIPTKSFSRNGSGIPEGWTIVEDCVTPSIINISNISISFDHIDGVYTPTAINVNLSEQYTNEVLLSMIPMCNIYINIIDKNGSTLQENILWENTRSLDDLLNYCHMSYINVSDIAIVILDVDIPNEEDYYYY